MPQILLYDEKEMHIFDVIGYYPEEPLVEPVDITTIEQIQTKRAIFQDWSYKAEIAVGKVKAELDPTTMKQIAKYNLDKDFEELNRQIKSAEERLKNLNEQAEEKEQKLELMRELFPKIWNDTEFEQDNYLPDEDCNYEEDDLE
ncbi:MAG: hypothetical protein HFH72_09125 [Lachnospiraceae bacterium]|nr:hypothetical protein [Lachnospiraceae bacterium]